MSILGRNSTNLTILAIILIFVLPMESGASPLGVFNMCDDGNYAFDLTYSYISRNLKIEEEKAYARINRMLLTGEYGFSGDINIYGTIGMSTFGDENIDPDFGFSYGAGIRVILYKFKNNNPEREGKRIITIRADAQYFGFSSTGKSRETDVGVDNKWQEGQLTIAPVAQWEKWDLYGGISLDLTRGNIQVEESDQVTFTENLAFGIRAGIAIKVNENFNILLETGLLDESSVGFGGTYNIVRKKVSKY